MSHPPAAEPVGARPRRLGAVWCVLAAIVSVQLGAAFAKNLFGRVPPVSMVWLRLASAAVVLWTFARPRIGTRTPRAWFNAAWYIAGLLGMNWAIYESFARIPLGLAVTIEFLGPLTLATLTSRRRLDLVWIALAAAGVALLGFTPTHLDPLGVLLALVAGAGWASYIYAGSRVAPDWDGLTVITLGCTVGAVLFAAPGIAAGGRQLWHPPVLLIGAAVGVLSSVLPYSLELVALRTLPPNVFGILMSLEPAAAALAAVLVLGERLSSPDVVAIACVVLASLGASRTTRPEPQLSA